MECIKDLTKIDSKSDEINKKLTDIDLSPINNDKKLNKNSISKNSDSSSSYTKCKINFNDDCILTINELKNKKNN